MQKNETENIFESLQEREIDLIWFPALCNDTIILFSDVNKK